MVACRSSESAIAAEASMGVVGLSAGLSVLWGETWSVVLQQVAVDVEGSMEDPEDIDHVGGFDHVGDSIVAVQQDADVPVWSLPVPVA